MSSYQPEHVNNFHDNSDVDTGDLAQHHTLGFGPNQAAPGIATNRRLTVVETLVNTVRVPLPISLVNNTWTLLSIAAVGANPAKNLSQEAATVTSNVWTLTNTGWYSFSSMVQFAANATGIRAIFLKFNSGTPGTSVDYRDSERGSVPSAGIITYVELNTQFYAAAGETISVFAIQTSGAALTVGGNTYGDLMVLEFKGNW
jgi:hypothetical protein